LQSNLLALSLPDMALGNAELLRDKIQSVLSQMAFRHNNKPYGLTMASAVAQMRPDETMVEFIKRCRQNLGLVRPIKSTPKAPKRVSKKRPPDLTVVR